jgi:hypothetical protein
MRKGIQNINIEYRMANVECRSEVGRRKMNVKIRKCANEKMEYKRLKIED